MPLITCNLPKEKGDRKRWLEIASNKDWKWCSYKNRRVLTENKRRRLWIPGIGVPINNEVIFTEKLKNSFIWISFFVEGHNIKSDIPRDVFEEICSFL